MSVDPNAPTVERGDSLRRTKAELRELGKLMPDGVLQGNERRVTRLREAAAQGKPELKKGERRLDASNRPR